jgi:dolichol-phosphate mannosyltransferase
MTLLSIVIPVLNEERNIHPLAARLREVVGRGFDYEVIFVNDGSTDATVDILQTLHDGDKRVKAVNLARNFGHQTAISAGLHAACGEAVVVMDGDLQDAPEVIPHFITRWREGYDVVYAVRARREGSWPKRLAYLAFYRALRIISQIDIPPDSGDFSLMDRRVVDEINAMPERTRFIRGMRSWVGFRQIGVDVARSARHAGEAKYTWRRLVRLALDGFFGFSSRPLQLAAVLGLGTSAVALAIAVTLVLLWVLHGIPLQGWTSLMVTVLFMGGIQLISLGILGEYVGRIYDEARGRPPYVVASVVGDTRLEPAPDRRQP